MSREDHDRFVRRAADLRTAVEELTAEMISALGTAHSVTLRAQEIDACFQRLEWALSRSTGAGGEDISLSAHS